MNIYTCTDFEGHYPVGTAAVVVASSRVQAAKHLETALASRGLQQTVNPESMKIIDPTHQSVRILCDGNY